MADVASLLVRIGADASSYLATTQRTRDHTAQVFGAIRGILRSASDDITQILGVKMPAALQQGFRGVEQFSAGLGMLGRGISLTSNLAKVGMGPISILIEGVLRGALAFGTAIRPLVNEISGFTQTTLTAGTASQSFVAGLVESKDAYLTALGVYDQLRRQVGLTGDQYKISGENTRENAVRLVAATGAALGYGKQLRITKDLQKEANEHTLSAAQIYLKLHDAILTQDAALKGATTSLEKMYGVLDKDTAHKRMEEVINDIALLSSKGVDSGQIYAKFADEIEGLATTAKGLGMELPAPFDELVAAVKNSRDGIMLYFDDIASRLGRYIPEQADKVAAALKSSLGAAGGEFRKVSGELTGIGDQLNAIATNSWKIQVTVDADWTKYDAAARQRGLNPDTGGRLPGP